MKKLILPAIIIVSLLTITGIVLADAPTVTLNPIGPLVYATFPQIYNVIGTIYHEPNATSVSEVNLYINNIKEGATINPNVQNQTTATFSLPWNITGPGTYNVKVTARHGNDTGSADEDVVVIETPVVITECPAAPSIAAHYLQEKEPKVKPGSKTYKNVISLVAQKMGPQTEFNEVTACAEGYAPAVKLYVDELLAHPVSK